MAMLKSAPKAKVMMMKWCPATRSEGRPRMPATRAVVTMAKGIEDQKPRPNEPARMAAVYAAHTHQRRMGDREHAGLAEEDAQAIERDGRDAGRDRDREEAVAVVDAGCRDERRHDQQRDDARLVGAGAAGCPRARGAGGGGHRTFHVGGLRHCAGPLCHRAGPAA